MRALSLKSRFAIVMSIGALAIVIGLGAISINFEKKDLLATLSSQQLGLVTRAAEDLDAKLKLARDSLSVSAAAIPGDVATSQPQFVAFNTVHPSLLQLFDEILVLDVHGIVVADYPYKDGRIGLDLGGRNYFREALTSAKTVVSEPLRGKLSGRPLVNIAAPIVDAGGRVIAVMVGSLSLATPNILGSLSSARLGETGYFTVVTSGPEPIYLAHPDPALLMTKVPIDRSRAMARAVNSTSGGVGVSSLEDGSKALVSSRPLSMNHWVLAAIMPSAEAFATIDRARERTVRIGLAVALIVLPLVWLFAWRLLRPLTLLRGEIERITGDANGTSMVRLESDDEVGLVAGAFNALLTGQRASEAQRIASEEDRRRLGAIIENSQDFVAMTDPGGRVTYLNRSARALAGIGADDALPATHIDGYFPDWAARRVMQEGVPAALANGTWIGETAVRAGDGSEVPVDHTVIAHRSLDGRLEFFSSLMHDTSAAKAAAADMRSSEARMLSIADALPVLVAFIDRDYRFRFVNSRYEEHFGIDRSRIIGISLHDLLGPDVYAFYLPYLQAAAAGETQVFERESSSGVRPVHFLVKLIPQYDEHGQLIGYHFIHQDITDHKAENQRLSQLVRVDALTGLLNRAGFEAAIDEAMRRSQSHLSSMALFYLDIDRFKSINDQHGHLVGDALLRAFSDRLVRAVRGADTVARLGGDEFVVIAEGVRHPDGVRSIAQKVLHAMRPTFIVDGVALSITASIGVASYQGEALQADELIGRADAALYRAKHAGRDRYDLDDPVVTPAPTEPRGQATIL